MNQGIALAILLLSLIAAADWRPEVAEAIDQLIATHGGISAHDIPVAVFDWDNTIAKHDVSDAVFYTMLEKEMMFAPPGDDLKRVTSYFTNAASAAIRKNCERFRRTQKTGYLLAGNFYRTQNGPKAKSCRQEFLSIYENETTTTGEAAFVGGPGTYNYRRVEPSYVWLVHTLTGLSRQDIYSLTNEVLDARTSTAAKERRTQTIDGFEVAAFLEIYNPMASLIERLINNGFDVWVVSASNQYVVETFAQRLNQMTHGAFGSQRTVNHLESEDARRNIHVIGVQVEEAKGQEAKELLASVGLIYQGDSPVLVNRLKGCGNEGINQTMTYIEGKPCFIDKGVFGGDGTTFKKRPVFAAGDANTDVAMLQSATSLSIVINRNYNELMCNAYQSTQLVGEKKWFIQPMFIQPCPRRDLGYDCSRCTQVDGTKGPCMNEQGQIIATPAIDMIYVEGGEGKVSLDCHR